VTAVFADTFYYLSLLDGDDNRHADAIEMTSALAGRIVTTDWVLTELADGLCRSNTRLVVARFIVDVLVDPDVTVVPADRAMFESALNVFQRRPDKDWSLTDCVSFVVMQQRNISEALTADHHFEQAGFRALMKR
jgi:predicted nucleic acid-binding protein